MKVNRALGYGLGHDSFHLALLDYLKYDNTHALVAVGTNEQVSIADEVAEIVGFVQTHPDRRGLLNGVAIDGGRRRLNRSAHA